MKKLSLFVGAIALSTAVFAQNKPASADAHSSLEGQLNIMGSGGGTDINFNSPTIRYRYFVNDNIAARVSLSIMSDKETHNHFENEGDNSGQSGSYEYKMGGWSLGIGGEYHLKGTEKLSPYGGLAISFGGGKETWSGTNATDLGLGTWSSGFAMDHTEESEMAYSTLGVTLLGGFDYYFAQNVYIGAEMGWGFMSRTDKAGSMTSTDPAPIGTVTVTGNEMKSSGMSNSGVASFRLGWRF